MEGKMKHVVVGVVVLAMGLVLLGGCASTGPKYTENISGVLTKQSQTVAAGKKQIDDMLASLNGRVTAQSDLKPAFAKYSDQLKGLINMRENVRKKAQELEVKKEEYLKEWQAQMANIQDPGIKAAAEARKQTVAEDYATLGHAIETAKGAVDPFIQYCKDIQQYLAFDLTSGGIEAIKPIGEKAKQEGTTVSGALDEMIKEFDKLSQKIGPSTGTAPKK